MVNQSPPQPIYVRQRKPATSIPSWRRILHDTVQVILGIVLVFVLGVFVLITLHQVQYQGRIVAGVWCYGVDLSGLPREQAAALLAAKNSYPAQGLIGFRYGENTWIYKPGELGLSTNIQESVAQAERWGRRMGLLPSLKERLQAWFFGVELPLLRVYDERIANHILTQLATQINQPAVDAQLHLDGLTVKVTPAQTGKTLNVQATLEQLRTLILSEKSGWVDLVVEETKPTVVDVEQEAQQVRRILSAPFTLTSPDPLPQDVLLPSFSPQELAQWLTLRQTQYPEEGGVQVVLQLDELRPRLEQLALKVNASPEDARFIFNDETRQLELIKPAVIGRYLVVDKTLRQIEESLLRGEHQTALVYDRVNPRVMDNATAQELQITSLVGEYTSYFYGSDEARIQNIVAAASRFHGLLVAPGEVFSMASVMGDVSLDTGFAEALIIYGDRTIKGVGGGVCQVSTTLFRNAFFSGFPIIERHPHAYRVSYYEYTAGMTRDPQLAGLDATVFVPVVDFKFKNDLSSWLLMETYVNVPARTLKWKFYGTPDGRTVEWETTGLTHVVEAPEPRYVENPELPPGKIKQVDWAADGADVKVSRTVYRNGAVYFTDEFFTHYVPWADVYEVGPGTELPDDKSKGEYKKDKKDE